VTAHDFSGEVVAVTGAARGLGLAIARAFFASGARVALMDVEEERLSRAASQLGSADRARGIAVDVGAESSVAAAFAAAERTLGPVTVLVANAGICGTERFVELELASWQRAVSVNLTGTFLCMKAVVPGMIARGTGGRIVTVGSLAGRNGGIATSVAYSASKAGIAGLTRAAARQLAEHHILVNCVAPSTLETDMTAGWPAATLDRIRASAPLGRLGRVDDVVGVVLFLASGAAGYLTGVTLDVTGGLFMAP